MSCSGDGDGAGGARKSNSDQRTFQDVVENEGASHSAARQRKSMTEDEKRIICQARFLLESYVMEEAQRDHMPSEATAIIRTAVLEEDEEEGELSQEDQDQLRDVGLAFRKIGDEVNESFSKDSIISNLINSVQVGSEEEIFKKVCMQMFEDGQVNWGRIFVLFYFAYKIIAKALTKTHDCVGWIKSILKTCVGFFAEYFVWWVVQRGGWRMIKEYWGTSRGTFAALVVASIASALYVYYK